LLPSMMTWFVIKITN